MTGPGEIRRLAAWSIAISFAVMGVKFVAWKMTGSVALFSDALESIVNVIASFIAWYAIGFSQRPADESHPFGHHKAEYFSAVLEGVLIVVAALLIVQEAWQAFSTPRLADDPWAGMAVNAGAGAVNGFWAWLLVTRGRRAKSPALVADGQHILSDVVTSAGVLLGLFAALITGHAILDPVLALLVAINILWQGYKLIGGSLNALMDHALSEDEQAEISQIIADSSEGALEFHDLKTREAGPARFAEFHLVVPSAMSVARSHEICDAIEAALKERLPGIRVTIHVEPEHKKKPDGIRV